LFLVAALLVGGGVFAAHYPENQMANCLQNELKTILNETELKDVELTSVNESMWGGWYYFAAGATRDFSYHPIGVAQTSGGAIRARKGELFQGFLSVTNQVLRRYDPVSRKTFFDGIRCDFDTYAHQSGTVVFSLSNGEGVNVVSLRGTQPAAPNRLLNYGCFPAGTKVLTASGSTPIEDIQVGQKVLSLGAPSKLTEGVVTKLHRIDGIELVEVKVAQNGGMKTIVTTEDHPFVLGTAGNPLVAAGELQLKNALISTDGQSVDVDSARVISVARTGRLATVYNLTVSDSHTYFVDGFLVHNKQ